MGAAVVVVAGRLSGGGRIAAGLPSWARRAARLRWPEAAGAAGPRAGPWPARAVGRGAGRTAALSWSPYRLTPSWWLRNSGPGVPERRSSGAASSGTPAASW